MSARTDLPKNEKADEYHRVVQQAIMDYLRHRTDRAERKNIVKEAINEWLDEKYRQVGRWTVAGILASALAAIGYFILTQSGWHK